MARDLLRVQTNERVDLTDFDFLADESIQANIRHYGEQFLADPAKTARAFVLDGFIISNPALQQVQVELGRAILGIREGGQIFQGVLTSEGEATRIQDVSTFANGTYGIYIRFEYVEAESLSRAFWNPQALGSEFAQTIPTRRVANWSMRIELSTPGAEWLQVGQVIVAASAISTAAGGLVDLRDLYFEGQRDADIAPATPADNGTQFESGWSTDGGGVANDRSDDRELYGVKDLHTFAAAMRQCVEDLKGRGLKRWWERDIGGMNIGFDADPVSKFLAVGDADFGLDFATANLPAVIFDDFEGAAQALIGFNRTSNHFEFEIEAITEMWLTPTGLKVGDGLVVGHTGTPVTDKISLGDVDFNLDFTVSTDPTLWFDETNVAGISFDRTANQLTIQTALLNGIMRLDSTGLEILDGLSVGFAGAVDDTVSIGDANFNLYFDGTDPLIRLFGGADYLKFDRSENELSGVFNTGNTSFVFSDEKKPVTQLANPDISDALTTPSGWQPFTTATYTVPSATVAVGQEYRIRAGGVVAQSTASAYGIQVLVGSDVVYQKTTSQHGSADSWTMDIRFRLKTLHATTGSVYVARHGYFEQNTTDIHELINFVATNFDTSGNLVFSVNGTVTGGDSSDILTCHYFQVEKIY